MYVCMCVCMYVCLYVCMYVCMYVYMYVCMYVCMCVCVYVCMYVCMYVYMYVCMYRIHQIIRGETFSQYLWIFAYLECFTIENFPWISALSTNYIKHGTTWSYKQLAKRWNVMWHMAYYICYQFFNGYCISISWISILQTSCSPITDV